jgi:hypothetical protein
VSRTATLDDVRRLALALPEAEEHVTYRRPSFKVKRKLFAWLPDDETVVVKVDPGERDMLEQADPETYVVSDHHRGSPLMAVPLARVDEARLAELLEDAWLWTAPETLRRRHAP